MNTHDPLRKCMNTLILDESFFATLALHLKIRADESIGTFATNGSELIYSPTFAQKLSEKEVVFVIAHEVLHCALGHIWRRDSRDPQKWNVACDYVVNAMLIEHINKGCQVMSMPTMGLYDRKYHGMSCEEIYNTLPDEASSPPPQPQPCGSFTDPPPDSPENEAEADQSEEGEPDNPSPKPSQTMTESEWKIVAVQALNSAKSSTQGSDTSELDRLVKDRIDPAIPWQELLREFTSTITRDDYTWTRPNKRYLPQGFCLPTLYTKGVGDIVIAIDTSGSVCPQMLTAFLSEVQSLLDTAKPSSITLLSCDTGVKNAKKFLPGDDLTAYHPRGGGGTAFEPVFEYIDHHDINPLALVYFTDGYGSCNTPEPHYPTLWLDYGGSSYPFGHVINVPANQYAA